MKKRFLVANLTVIILYLGIFSCSATSALTAEEMNALMIDSIKDAQTYKFTFKANIGSEMMDLKQPDVVLKNESELSGQGAMNITSRTMAVTINVTQDAQESSPQSTEIFAMNDTLYSRQNDEWSKMAITSPDELWSIQEMVDRQADLVNQTQIAMDGSDEIDGDYCYRLKIIPDSESGAMLLASQIAPFLGASFPAMNASNLFMNLSNNTKILDWTVWITRDGHLLKKNSMKAETTLNPDIFKSLLQANTSIIMHLKIDNTVFYKEHNTRTEILLPEDATNVGELRTIPSALEGKSASSSFGELVSHGIGPNTVEFEPNDQIGDATEIQLAAPVGVQGKITPAGDVDFYKFYVDSAGMLELKMDQIPEEMKTRIDIYGKNFNWITRKDASNPGDQITLQIDLPDAGQGFIAISDLDGKAHPSDYSFTANFLPAKDDGEPNNQVGDSTEIGVDQTVSAHICPVDDVDFYRFYVNYAGIMEVKLDQVPSDMKTRIDLYNKNFNWVTRKDASNAGDTLDWVVDLPGPAVHYIAFSDLDRKARSDPYSFQITFQQAPDSDEPNNQIGDSTDMGLGQTVTGYICPVDDVDFYKIWVDSSAILEAKLEKVPSDMKARIDLYGKNNNWITRADASNAGDAITLKSDLPGPGAYYMAVSDLDRKAHADEYQLMAVLKSQ